MPQENAIPESHIRLVATPTAGVPAEHSPYYRRLVSAGYKGHLQGNIAGASLYGILGAGVGIVAAVAISIATGGAANFLLCAAAFGGYGVLKGAATFGQIGSNAAQLAEYAEMNERRNALLDRLYETPSKEEAAEIRKLLQSDSLDKPPTRLIHFRTALIGAIIGAVAIAGLVYIGAGGVAGPALAKAVTGFIGPLVGESIIANGGIAIGATAKLLAISAGAGAVMGSLIGIDRGWIRRWFDVSEGAVHERDYYDKIAQERAQEVTRLHRIGQNEMREMATTITRGDLPLTPAANDASAIQPVATQETKGDAALPKHAANDASIQPVTAQETKGEIPLPKLAANDIEEKGRVQELQRAAASV